MYGTMTTTLTNASTPAQAEEFFVGCLFRAVRNTREILVRPNHKLGLSIADDRVERTNFFLTCLRTQLSGAVTNHYSSTIKFLLEKYNWFDVLELESRPPSLATYANVNEIQGWISKAKAALEDSGVQIQMDLNEIGSMFLSLDSLLKDMAHINSDADIVLNKLTHALEEM